MELKIDSLIYDDNGKLFNGKIKDKVGNKTIEYEVVEGKKHGKFRLYFPNDQVEMEGEIVKNKNEGLWKYYYPTGQMEALGNFKDDQADGKWEWYFPWGTLRETAEYSAGLRNGTAVKFDSLGNVIEKKNFINGLESD
jgi:antitoxin component YwqK of YwqJK toxin-antitoxin module